MCGAEPSPTRSPRARTPANRRNPPSGPARTGCDSLAPMTGRRPIPGGWRWLAPALLAAVALGCATAPASGQGGGDRPSVLLVTFSCSEENFLCTPFRRAVRRTGVEARIVSPDIREDPVGTLSLLARGGDDLVIADVNWLHALAVVAPRFPGTRFGFFDGPLFAVRGRPRNVAAVHPSPTRPPTSRAGSPRASSGAARAPTSSAPWVACPSPRSTSSSPASRQAPGPRRPASRSSSATRTTSRTRPSARRSRGARSRAAPGRCSTSPAPAAWGRSVRRAGRGSGASGSTATSRSSGPISSRASSRATRPASWSSCGGCVTARSARARPAP